MAICIGYFEQNQPDSATITVAGYIAYKPRWRFFEERWPRVLRGEGVSTFNGSDFVRGTGEFADWHDNDARRKRLIETLSRLVTQHVLRGFSCSVRLEDYDAITYQAGSTDAAIGPYAICAARLMVSVQHWMIEHHPDDLTLWMFEDGDIDHRDVRRCLAAEGMHRGEPAQIWPRQWTDERGRRRLLRPFEACDLLIPGCQSDLPDRLQQRSAWQHELIGHEHLSRITEASHRLALSRRDVLRLGSEAAEGRAGGQPALGVDLSR